MSWMGTLEITASCIHFSRKMLSRIYFCVFLQWLCSCIFSKMQCYWWSVIPHPRLQVDCNCWCLGRLLLSILPLQVEEIKRRQYTLAFTSAGAQAQTYHISFETLAECQRWHRQASTVRPWGWCGFIGRGTPQEGYSDASLVCSQRWSQDAGESTQDTFQLYFLHALDYRDFSVSLLFFSTCATVSSSGSVLF